MKHVRLLTGALVMAALLAGPVGCASEEIAARVNGEEITKAELDAQVERLSQQNAGMFEGEGGDALLQDFRRSLLTSMIDAILLRQAAEERGIAISEEEIDLQIDGIRAEIEDFDAQLAAANMTIDDLRRQIRDQLVAQRLIEELARDVSVTEEEIRSYYEQNKDRFTQGAMTHAAHILFEPAERATAERVLAEIRAGADFAALAREHSKDPGSAANGGDLGWADPSQYVQEFRDALAALGTGEVSDLVESEFGWHIVKLIDTREASIQPLDEVRATIEQLILQDRNTALYQEFLAGLRDAASIEYLIEELKPVDPSGEEAPPGEASSGQ